MLKDLETRISRIHEKNQEVDSFRLLNSYATSMDGNIKKAQKQNVRWWKIWGCLILMQRNETAISCSNIRKIFSDGPQDVQVLKNVNLEVLKGEMVGIVGPSGSGKTTLLNIIACFERPTSGEVFVDGVNIGSLGDSDVSFIRRHKIGMIFQDFYLLPTLSALENVEIPMIIAGIPEARRKERAVELLSSVDLSNRLFYRPDELSSGEKQRVAFARAMANDPPIILADEPTGNLDTGTGREIIAILRRITDEQGKAVVMATHDLDAVSNSNRVLVLKDGVVKALESIRVAKNLKEV